jgi:CubicO group peptidase (beta-lactamase class C family)
VAVEEYVDEIFGRPLEQGVSLAMVVVHRGEVVVERYGTQPENAFHPAVEIGPDSTLVSWSTAKSMTHAACGILVRDGLLDLDMPAPVPAWRDTDKAAITVLDLLEMRPGLRFLEDYVDGEESNCIAMLWGDGAEDHAAYAAGLPLDDAPGTVWNYSSGTTNIIASILGDIVGGGQEGMERFLLERLFGPTGMTTAIPKFDGVGTWVGSSFVYATARDFARFGELYRHDGVTEDGERILPEGWADHGRTFVAHDPTDDLPGGFDYGRHWWMWPEFPGSIAAHGYEGQYIVVVPDRELTIVHLGKTPAEQRRHVLGGIANLIRSVAVTA